MGSSWWRRPSLREGELLSDSDPVWARDTYENEPRQSTGGEQDPGPSHPANTKGSGYLGTGTSGSGGEQDLGPSHPASTGEQLLASEEMGIMGSPGAARTCATYTHKLNTRSGMSSASFLFFVCGMSLWGARSCSRLAFRMAAPQSSHSQLLSAGYQQPPTRD